MFFPPVLLYERWAPRACPCAPEEPAWAPWVGEQQRCAQPAAFVLQANSALLGGASPKTEDTHCEQVLSGLRDRQTEPLSKAVSGPSAGSGDGSSLVWIYDFPSLGPNTYTTQRHVFAWRQICFSIKPDLKHGAGLN